MSIISTIVDAINPQETVSAHSEARAKARGAARPGDWLALILEHHEQIEAAFAAVKSASTAAQQQAAQKELAVILTGHANAEETVIYPALSRAGNREQATTAYSEQATAKREMSNLETLAPLSPEYLQKLEQIRDAVAHHVYEEEGTWFPDLHQGLTAPEQATLARRYQEEFERYVAKAAPADSATTPSYGRMADPAAQVGRPM